MQATIEEKRSAAEWESLIDGLTAKARAIDTDIADLARDRDNLALDAELGIDGAAKKLQRVIAELASKQQAAGSLRTAIAQAQARLEDARAAEAKAVERERREKIGGLLREYLTEVHEVDGLMAQLAARFAKARSILDTAEDLMTGRERTAVQQLRSLFGPTLSAAHFGLGDHLELGGAAGHTSHRQPLEAFTRGFVDGWVKDGD